MMLRLLTNTAAVAGLPLLWILLVTSVGHIAAKWAVFHEPLSSPQCEWDIQDLAAYIQKWKIFYFSEQFLIQDKVNTADSASKSMVRLVRAEKLVLSGLVFARKIARMILIQNIQGLMGPLMINMAFMPLYMWEMWDVTPVTLRTNTRSESGK